MNTKSLTATRSVILTLALVLLTGIIFTLPAGERSPSPRTRENSQQLQRDTGANSVPRPVVDETPINPDSFGQRKGTPRHGRDLPRDQQKRRPVRR